MFVQFFIGISFQSKKKKIEDCVAPVEKKRTPEAMNMPEGLLTEQGSGTMRTTPKVTRTGRVVGRSSGNKKKGCRLLNERLRPSSPLVRQGGAEEGQDKENIEVPASWRRSIRPDQHTRLKRVDMGDTRPLANPDNKPLANMLTRPVIKQYTRIVNKDTKHAADTRPVIVSKDTRFVDHKGTRTPLAERVNRSPEH